MRSASVKDEVASADQRAKAIQQKLDRVEDGFIYQESIDLGTYEGQRHRLREELTLVEIDRHGSKVEEFDVEGILNFAERVLPRASDLLIQASLEQLVTRRGGTVALAASDTFCLLRMTLAGHRSQKASRSAWRVSC